MIDDLPRLEAEALSAVTDAVTLDDIRSLDTALLGKQSRLSKAKKQIASLDPDKRKDAGRALNEARQRVEGALERRRSEIAAVERSSQLEGERLDLTEVSEDVPVGHAHAITQAWDELEDTFVGMGFRVAEGPEIETDWYNFDALNLPPGHPSRDGFDTIYVNHGEPGSTLLRTHTSPVQIRTMLAQEPPIYIVAPGRVFRRDTADATHLPVFHQIEGLVIDEETHMGHLKWVLESFCKAFFEVDKVKMRFRASHFPFTEPSMEVDIGYAKVGDEIRIGEGDRWLEILGCGMVHPNVLKAVELDSKKYQGFAFGVGIDRLAMLKYGMPDLRAFFSGDLRWLKHYGFAPLAVPTLAAGLSR